MSRPNSSLLADPTPRCAATTHTKPLCHAWFGDGWHYHHCRYPLDQAHTEHVCTCQHTWKGTR